MSVLAGFVLRLGAAIFCVFILFRHHFSLTIAGAGWCWAEMGGRLFARIVNWICCCHLQKNITTQNIFKKCSCLLVEQKSIHPFIGVEATPELLMSI